MITQTPSGARLVKTSKNRTPVNGESGRLFVYWDEVITWTTDDEVFNVAITWTLKDGKSWRYLMGKYDGLEASQRAARLRTLANNRKDFERGGEFYNASMRDETSDKFRA